VPAIVNKQGQVTAVDRDEQWSGWQWTTLMLSSISIVAVVFATWELVQNRFFREIDYVTLHTLYITRGMASSLLLASWAAWYVLRSRRRSEQELRRSREHYRHLLEASPGAVALYDTSLRVTEWNQAAERLYGFSKAQVLGRPLPTVPAEKEAELRELLRKVEGGDPMAVVETLRRDAGGTLLEVQLSVLPFREGPENSYFLDVTEDLRERVRLRQTLLEVEKLTSMGKTAAGTAHHLNTPLAAMLLRVQMMRERVHDESTSSDLERLEGSLLFCQQFVRRLLEFSRRPAAEKQPEDVGRTLESVVSFLAPSLNARRARMSMDLDGVDGTKVFADRNLLEALFSILLANALDAIQDGGAIAVRCRPAAGGRVEVQIADDGCGIAPADLAHVFEPFFSTKGTGKGTGLGLAIARNIVREHGGFIRLESAPDRGTVALIDLPAWGIAPGGEKSS
jgi:PAS domain S-box-containing protein